MKNIIQLFTLGLFMATLSSCVDAGGYVNTGPGYPRHAPPRPYYRDYQHTHRYYSNNYPTYYHSRPAPRPSRVNARVNANVAPVRVRTGLGLF